MAVGQLWGVGAVPFSLGVAQGYVDYGRWPIVVWGAPDPGLRPGLPENGPSGLNRKHTLGTNQTHAATASWPDGFRG